MIYYHVTDTANVNSILSTGLKAPVFLSNNIGTCLAIRKQQEEEGDKTGCASVLKVWLSDKTKVEIDNDTDYDAFVVMEDISSERIILEFYV